MKTLYLSSTERRLLDTYGEVYVSVGEFQNVVVDSAGIIVGNCSDQYRLKEFVKLEVKAGS